MQITLLPNPGYKFSDDIGTKDIFVITYNTEQLKAKGIKPLEVITRRLAFTGLFEETAVPPAEPIFMCNTLKSFIEDAIFDAGENRRSGDQFKASNQYVTVVISKYEDFIVGSKLVPVDPTVRDFWGEQYPGTISVVTSAYGREAANFIEKCVAQPISVRTMGTADRPDLNLFGSDQALTEFFSQLVDRQQINPTIRDIYLQYQANTLAALGTLRITNTLRRLREFAHHYDLNVLIAIDGCKDEHSQVVKSTIGNEVDRLLTLTPWVSKEPKEGEEEVYDQWAIERNKLRGELIDDGGVIDVLRRLEENPTKH